MQQSSNHNYKNYKVRQAALEALIKAFELENDLATLMEIKTNIGYDHFRARYDYPYEVQSQLVKYLAEKFYPQMPLTQSLLEVAKRQAYAYINSTILGRITFAARGKMPHHKMLQLFCRNQNELYFTKNQTLEITGPNQARFMAADDPVPPTFMVTMLQEILKLNGAQNSQIQYHILSQDNIEYNISWEN